MTKDKALKLALEALEQLDGIDTETECVTIDVGDVIDAIKEALAQPEQYPQIAINPEIVGYVAPQRKPLTDKQIEEIAEGYLVDYRIPAGCAWNFARDIEAAHNILEQVDKNE